MKLLLLGVLVCVSQSSQQEVTEVRLARDPRVGQDFISGLAGNVNYGNCYDRCYTAHRINQNHVAGCECGQFDYTSLDTDHNCNCPAGTVCQREFGRTSCVSRGHIGGRLIGGGRYGSGGQTAGQVPGKEHCGFLATRCRASPGEQYTTYRYTYDYQSQACVKVAVYLTCSTQYGVGTNLFENQIECSRVCELNRG
ncbi:uncharacterized protein LOC131940410 [Physella acuta]|uniref:uncharacterized protein LOC131940410 n=1 Tax=Physella acuta TaxID=109671 RepID=UPI0027DACC4E|nr:uncharacterized protein LOC131940410 [Physella acuta]